MKDIKWDYKDVDISILNNEIIESVIGLEKGSQEVIFITNSGKAVKLYHKQDCCETFDLNDFECDTNDFNGSLVINAECVKSVNLPISEGRSETWSFYRIDTTKGLIWMRWLGESNGYYSEEVNIASGVVKGIPNPVIITEEESDVSTHVMIDLKTMGITPEMAIISIGAVLFDPKNNKVSGNTFYVELDWKNQDRPICPETEEWWSKQSEDTRSTLSGAGDLKVSLMSLAWWLPSGCKVWGNGLTFDISFLEHAYRQLGLEIPWSFYSGRDCRTVEDMYESAYGTFDKAISRKGHHNALEDAKFQAGYITMMWDRVLNDNQEKQKPLVAHKKGDEQ